MADCSYQFSSSLLISIFECWVGAREHRGHANIGRTSGDEHRGRTSGTHHEHRGHTIIVSSGMGNSSFLLSAKRKESLVNSVLWHGSTGGTEFSCAEVTASLQSTSPPATKSMRRRSSEPHSLKPEQRVRWATVSSGQEATGYTVASNSRVSWRVR